MEDTFLQKFLHKSIYINFIIICNIILIALLYSIIIEQPEPGNKLNTHS